MQAAKNHLILLIKKKSEKIQNPKKLDEWAARWQIKFAADNCKFMYVGILSFEVFIPFGYSKLTLTTQEKDLCITGNSSMKTSVQYSVGVQKKTKY